MTATETGINNINTTLTGFSTESTVAAGIAAAKSEAITEAGKLDAALKSDIEGTISTNNDTYVGRFAAVEDRVGEIEGALYGFTKIDTVAAGIEAAKGEAIADAEGKLATAKEEIDGRLDALEAVTDHGAEYVNGTVSAADIKADLLAYGMRVTYTPVSGASITLPAAADLKGRSAQVNIFVKAGNSVTVGDGNAQSETFTAPADCDMFYVFELVMTGQDTAAWYLAI